jgi:tetratricopeptide (TPR) repeat protein
MTSNKKFASEGFDLDAVATAENVENDVVYEIGGGATTLPTASEPASISSEAPSSPSEPNKPLTPLEQAEDWKQRGNVEYKLGNYLEAYDLYTEAIDVCPCAVKGKEILQQRDEFNAAEREKARLRMDEETRRGRSRRPPTSNNDAEGKKQNSKRSEESALQGNDEEDDDDDEEQKKGPIVFVLPPQENHDKLAVYYCNRAATSMQLDRYHEAIEDCDIAILLYPRYTKAYTRRSAAFEKTEQTDEALRDAKQALELEPHNAVIQKSVTRLQKLEDARLEKLKVCTIGKCFAE